MDSKTEKHAYKVIHKSNETKLTKAQKRELDLLKKSGGWSHVFDGRLLRAYRGLERKGLVDISAGYGQFQKGYHVILIT